MLKSEVEAVAEVATRRRYELWGVIWAFGALILFLCLASYSPKDPCFLIREGATGPVANWLGPAGALMSGWLYAALGFAAWLLPPALAWFSYLAFKGQELRSLESSKPYLALRALGAATLVISLSMFLSLAFGRIEWASEQVRSGGMVGHGLENILSGSMGGVGAFLVILLLLVVSAMAAFDFSPTRAARLAADLFGRLREAAADLRGPSFGRRPKSGGLALDPLYRDPPAVSVATAPAFENKTPTPATVPSKKRAGDKKEKADIAAETDNAAQERPDIKIVYDPKPRKTNKAASARKPKQEKFPFALGKVYDLPGVDLLDEVSEGRKAIDKDYLIRNAEILEAKFKDFGVKGDVAEVHPGPVVTMYEYKPGPGIKINKISNLNDDLAMALSAVSVRIVAPIPGKDVVGIEISNKDRETVYIREIAESDTFQRMKSPLSVALGKNTVGEPFCFDMRKAPHLLVAGSTGSGKSVGLNSMILSVLLKAPPRDVRLIMVDPKRLELSIYEGIPHLLHPVISDPKEASLALKWAVGEMERRYGLLAEQGVRHVDSYNKLVAKNLKELEKAGTATGQGNAGDEAQGPGPEGTPGAEAPGASASDTETPSEPSGPTLATEHLPVILVIIDELADLMMVAARDIEESICRLAQMARAAGIHLLIATQRPSVDVITGLIKANFPSRIAFKVSSKTDSRTILDTNGAERLLGQGDMLFLGPGTSDLIRLHGAFVSDDEIKAVTAHIREQGEPDYNKDIVAPQLDEKVMEEEEEMDAKWDDALAVAQSQGQVSVSMLQRKLKIGYNRAARMIEHMEAQGIVGPSDGVKPREVLLDPLPSEQSLA